MSLILRDIFGLEPKPASTSDDESSSECVVCMSAPRDTLVLPCRHLCLCKGCAEVLRFQVRAQVYDASPLLFAMCDIVVPEDCSGTGVTVQASKCPICRAEFHSLLQLRVADRALVPDDDDDDDDGDEDVCCCCLLVLCPSRDRGCPLS